MTNKSIRVGQVFNISGGEVATVKEVLSSSFVVVVFDSGHTATVRPSNLRKGQVKNPYKPIVFGIGYMGVGEFPAKFNRKTTNAYASWSSMLQRAYDPKLINIHETYRDVFVCEEWHNFQTFAEWFYQQPNAENVGFQLDKDLKVIGNKVYSPDTCSFIPQRVNKLLVDCGASRGEYPIGVSFHKPTGKFQANLSVNGSYRYLGLFSTAEEASRAYKISKESYIKEVAEEYKDILDVSVYKTLINFEVI